MAERTGLETWMLLADSQHKKKPGNCSPDVFSCMRATPALCAARRIPQLQGLGWAVRSRKEGQSTVDIFPFHCLFYILPLLIFLLLHPGAAYWWENTWFRPKQLFLVIKVGAGCPTYTFQLARVAWGCWFLHCQRLRAYLGKILKTKYAHVHTCACI